MTAVWLKSLADLRSRPWQAALIAVTVAASTSLLYLGLVSLKASSAPYEHLLARTNGPHVVFYLSGGSAGEQMAERIRRLPGVAGASPVWPSVVTQLRIPDVQAAPSVRLIPRAAEEVAVGRYAVVAGRDLRPSETGAALMDASMARFFGVKPGDTVEVAGSDGLHPVEVVGLEANSMELQYPWSDPVSLLVTPAGFGSLAGELVGGGGENTQLVVGVRLDDPEAADRFGENLAGTIQLDVDWKLLRDGFRSVNAVALVFTMAFGIMAVLASGLIAGNIAAGAVLAQAREIGVLQATGFTGGQVLTVYGSQNLLLGLGGGLVGTAAGYGLAAGRLNAIAVTMGTPEVTRFDVGVGTAVTLVTALVVLVSTLLPALRISRMRPASILSGGYERVTSRASLPVRLLRRLGAPNLVVLGVKDVTARPGRQALTTLGLVVSLAIVTATAGFYGMAGRLADRPDWLGLNWDLYVEPRALRVDQVRDALDANPFIEAYYPAAQPLAVVPDQDFKFVVTAAAGDWRSFPFILLEGRLPEGPGEIMLAPGAMNRIGARVGDSIRVELSGRTARLTVSGVYRYAMSLGRSGFMTLDSLWSIAPDAKVTTFLVRLKQGAVPEDAQRSILAATGYGVTTGILNKQAFFETQADVASSARAFAVLMAVISALGVLNATLLTAREQVRETGIRKAVGMTPAQILGTGAAGSSWLGLLGVVIGYPGGLLLTRQMASGMARQFGLGTLPVELSPALSAALVVGWIGLAVVAALPAAVWAGRLPTAEALRTE